MKEKLIELARDLGFVPMIIDINKRLPNDYDSLESTYYYLWMCELQKWIRNNKQLHLLIDWNYGKEGSVDYFYLLSAEDPDFEISYFEEDEKFYSTPEMAQEAGLLNLLKLINEKEKQTN